MSAYPPPSGSRAPHGGRRAGRVVTRRLEAVIVAGAAVAVEVVALFASPLHAYEGRPAGGPRSDPDGGARDRVEIRAGYGVVGDRYAGHAAHRTAAVTVFA